MIMKFLQSVWVPSEGLETAVNDALLDRLLKIGSHVSHVLQIPLTQWKFYLAVCIFGLSHCIGGLYYSLSS